MTVTINGTTGIVFPAGGTGNPVGTVVGTTDTQTLTSKTLTSPTINGTPAMGASVITSGSLQNSTSGTSVPFTGIPSWVKRITVMLNGVSTNGTSNLIIQIGSGSYTTSGYVSSAGFIASASAATVTATAGFIILGFAANTDAISAVGTLCNITGNVWTWSGTSYRSGGSAGTGCFSGLPLTLSGALDRLQLNTVSGDTFDAGSINIQYE